MDIWIGYCHEALSTPSKLSNSANIGHVHQSCQSGFNESYKQKKRTINVFKRNYLMQQILVIS